MSTALPALRENVLLAPMTTLGVGGAARYFLQVNHADAAAAGVHWARERGLPALVIGGGSNLLVADDGFPGLVLRVAVRGVESRGSDGLVEVAAGAGENWHALVARTVARNWAGLECLAGIPGRVGATPIQNVGAYGQEVGETIMRVEALDLRSGAIVTLRNADCEFGYRESRFKRVERGRFIILKVHYRLEAGGAPTVCYLEIERQLGQWSLSHPSLADVHAAVLAVRRRKSMLLDPRDPNTRSAGSFFINPVLTASEVAALEAAEAARLHHGERVLVFPTVDGRFKVPAAWLIERAGYARGHTCGSVGLSDNHAQALVNRGDATARDIIAFAREIRTRVRDRFGILLTPEPTFVGLSLDEEPGEDEHHRP